MGVDKSYGSGKPRSAANSRARQRVASGNMTKGPTKTSRALKNISTGTTGLIDFVVNGPEHAKGYQQLGVQSSKGFVQAAAKVAGAANRRFGIQQVKQTMAARKGYTSGDNLNSKITSPNEYADDLTNLTPWAANRAALDLKQTIGPRSAYTALKDESSKIGRGMSKDIRKVEYAMDKFGPNSAIARDQALKWHAKRDAATAFKQEAKKLVKGKNTEK